MKKNKTKQKNITKQDLVIAYCKDKSLSKNFTPANGIYSDSNYFQLVYSLFHESHAEPTIKLQVVDNYIDCEGIYNKIKNPQKLKNEIINFCSINNLKYNTNWMNGFRIILQPVSIVNRKASAIWKDCKNEYLKYMPKINDIIYDNM